MRKRVLLYGDSVFLGGLAAQLQKIKDIVLVQQSADNGPLKMGNLDVIVVDFDDTDAADVLAFLHASPDLTIVGIRASGSAVTVLSGKVYLAHTIEDVVRCIDVNLRSLESLDKE